MPHPEPCEACARDERARAERIDALVRAHRDLLARVARAEGLVGEDVLEAVQDAFGAFLARPAPPEADAAQDRRTLLAFTRNLARNRRRLHAVARPHVGDEAVLDALPATDDAPEALLLAAEARDRVACCVARLADVQRAVVTRRMLEERPGVEVARELGVTPAHVATLLYRAKAVLATCLSEDEP